MSAVSDIYGQKGNIMKTTSAVDTRKTIDSYDIEGLYYGEWSVECSEGTYAEAKRTLKEYRDNCPQTPFRIKHHVEKNPNFKEEM